MDMPRTPGDWSYRQGRATYTSPQGGAIFTMACDRSAGRITLLRAGVAGERTTMRIFTETASRSLDSAGGTAGVNASLTARDPLLDAMAFSKGRFAVEVPNAQTLYLPSWIEVSRVIEDCR